MSANIKVVRVETPQQMEMAWAIRNEVFIGEQGVTPAEEIDGLDDLPSTHHLLALSPVGEPMGTARMLVEYPGLVKVGRVAVRQHARGTNIGKVLMHTVEQIAADEFMTPSGVVRIELSAQESAIDFYQKLGYVLSEERYLDARIWHQDAHKVISSE